MTTNPQGEIQELAKLIELTATGQHTFAEVADMIIKAGFSKPSPGPIHEAISAPTETCDLCGHPKYVGKSCGCGYPGKDAPSTCQHNYVSYGGGLGGISIPKCSKCGIKMNEQDCQPKVWPKKWKTLPKNVTTQYWRGKVAGANEMHDAFMSVINGGNNEE